MWDTTIEKFEINKYILFNRDELIWSSDSKDIYNVTKDLYVKEMLFFWCFYSSNNPKKQIYHGIHKKM